MTYTLTYSEGVQGWVSFYSYEPDWMIGMNNYFYTFKGGNIYRHNVNALRNNFYGVQYNSMLKSVFNDVPLENKLFKTLNLEGDDSWEADMTTDLQYTGFIQAAWFERKEASWFAFVRNSGTVPADPQEYPLRSLNGIGRSSAVTIVGPTTTIDFSISPLVAIDHQYRRPFVFRPASIYHSTVGGSGDGCEQELSAGYQPNCHKHFHCGHGSNPYPKPDVFIYQELGCGVAWGVGSLLCVHFGKHLHGKDGIVYG
jgi:hypothetical protein